MWASRPLPSDPFKGAWLSIDPGDRHFATAMWQGHRCEYTEEQTPEVALGEIEDMFKQHRLDHIVWEKFNLQGNKAALQVGSEFETSQAIGVLKYLCNQYWVPFTEYTPSTHKAIYRTDWFKALSLKEKRKLAWWGSGSGEHCKDAWCAGMWFRQERGYCGLADE